MGAKLIGAKPVAKGVMMKKAATNAAVAARRTTGFRNTKAGNGFPQSRRWNRLHCFGGEYVVCVVLRPVSWHRTLPTA
jgi:hypothetical protein